MDVRPVSRIETCFDLSLVGFVSPVAQPLMPVEDSIVATESSEGHSLGLFRTRVGVLAQECAFLMCRTQTEETSADTVIKCTT